MERYEIGKDFNTKDWFVYDNKTNRYCWFKTEEEAEFFRNKMENYCQQCDEMSLMEFWQDYNN